MAIWSGCCAHSPFRSLFFHHALSSCFPDQQWEEGNVGRRSFCGDADYLVDRCRVCGTRSGKENERLVQALEKDVRTF